ncbi:hypothetical protein EK904_003407 [Melospiza melodia maxima]|nr:hypothetical protein EK904_003407 [Melospiza melodia maxima]
MLILKIMKSCLFSPSPGQDLCTIITISSYEKAFTGVIKRTSYSNSISISRNAFWGKSFLDETSITFDCFMSCNGDILEKTERWTEWCTESSYRPAKRTVRILFHRHLGTDSSKNAKEPTLLVININSRHTSPDEITAWPDSLFQLPVVEEVAGLDITVNNAENWDFVTTKIYNGISQLVNRAPLKTETSSKGHPLQVAYFHLTSTSSPYNGDFNTASITKQLSTKKKSKTPRATSGHLGEQAYLEQKSGRDSQGSNTSDK